MSQRKLHSSEALSNIFSASTCHGSILWKKATRREKVFAIGGVIIINDAEGFSKESILFLTNENVREIWRENDCVR